MLLTSCTWTFADFQSLLHPFCAGALQWIHRQFLMTCICFLTCIVLIFVQVFHGTTKTCRGGMLATVGAGQDWGSSWAERPSWHDMLSLSFLPSYLFITTHHFL